MFNTMALTIVAARQTAPWQCTAGWTESQPRLPLTILISRCTLPCGLRERTRCYSLVARDSAAGELGVAVASRFFAVGTVIPWAKAGIGAVATQAYANTSFGWQGLDPLPKGNRLRMRSVNC